MSNKNFLYKYKDKKFNFDYSEKCFIPTTTSDLLIKSSSKYLKNRKKVLDLGCGIGIVSIVLSKLRPKLSFYASDLHGENIKFCKKNNRKFKTNILIKKGSIFKPWRNEKFDLIIDDISGVVENIGILSPWFKNIPCASGNDGTKLVCEVINESMKYLTKKGFLIFPIISLSNEKKILNYAIKNFNHVKLIDKVEWFLPDKMLKYKKLLKILKSKNIIYYKEKFGKIICNTKIYLASGAK